VEKISNCEETLKQDQSGGIGTQRSSSIVHKEFQSIHDGKKKELNWGLSHGTLPFANT
jgi:hypothetical protein